MSEVDRGTAAAGSLRQIEATVSGVTGIFAT
jgi:hypothetical protein